jgi:hypothetical protein
MAGITEIKNFIITFDGLLWLTYTGGRFPIIMSLADLSLMFDQEGLNISQANERDENGCDAYHFKKVVLCCNHVKLHVLKNEYGDECSPEWCWVKD